MGVLIIRQGGKSQRVEFSGTPLLEEVLSQAGIEFDHPCGGRGVCGKCAAEITGQVSAPNAAERRAGHRLTCQARLLGDAAVWLPEFGKDLVEISSTAQSAGNPMAGSYGAAVDIGTTTLALKLYDLQSGRLLASGGRMNPQRAVAADVMGRIGAAMAGGASHLQSLVREALGQMLDQASMDAGIPREALSVMVVTGNTTMLYLITGRNPECLSHAPFLAGTLFDFHARLLDMAVYYPPCMNAFVGADITCAVLASGMCENPQTSLLCDIGTNGEIALWKNGKLYVTSTAAGPAFEGAGISCGCGSIPGAIDRVWVENGQVQCHTIGDAPPAGVCGSGLIDAIAAFRETGMIDETGASAADVLPLKGEIHLLPKDVRAIQLAKAAIRAGIQTLLESALVPEAEVATVYIAGGFGSHLNVASAAAIGLIPSGLQDRVRILGNAALSGAGTLLLNQDRLETARSIAAGATHLDLGGNPRFNENYIEQMLFPAESET